MRRNNTDPRVDAYINALPAWQQNICRQVRAPGSRRRSGARGDHQAHAPAVFLLEGNVCALLAAKKWVNVFVYDGAIVPDPHGIITSGHHNKTARTVAIRQGERSTSPPSRPCSADYREQSRRRLEKAEEGAG